MTVTLQIGNALKFMVRPTNQDVSAGITVGQLNGFKYAGDDLLFAQVSYKHRTNYMYTLLICTSVSPTHPIRSKKETEGLTHPHTPHTHTQPMRHESFSVETSAVPPHL